MKKVLLFLLACLTLVLILFACRKNRYKDFSKEGGLIKDTLPADYPFMKGLCDDGGASLGIAIVDTAKYRSSSTSPLPPSVLLDMPPVGDQGQQGSCAAWATAYALGSYYMHMMTGRPYMDTMNLNPGYTYNQITKGNCTCTSLLDNIYLMQTQGVSSMGVMPYTDRECSTQPTTRQKANAASYKIKEWQGLPSTDTLLIKRALVEKHPVAFGVNVDEGFNYLQPPYIWKERTDRGEGHGMVVIGYDDSKHAFRIQNSWSRGWADEGRAWIDYTFFVENVYPAMYIVL